MTTWPPLAKRLGWRYSRYADDLTQSLPHDHKDKPRLGALVGTVRGFVEAEGFTIHPSKTRVSLAGSRQTITGLVVNGDQAPGSSAASSAPPSTTAATARGCMMTSRPPPWPDRRLMCT